MNWKNFITRSTQMDMDSQFCNAPDLAEALWLMGCLMASGDIIKNRQLGQKSTQPVVMEEVIGSIASAQPSGMGAVISAQQSGSGTGLGRQARLADKVYKIQLETVTPAYLQKLPALRALRPLKRKKADYSRPPVLLLEETVQNIARHYLSFREADCQENLALSSGHLAVAPSKTHMYDLALVVDTYVTMPFYARDLQVLLDATQQSGAFGRVQIYALKKEKGGIVPSLYAQSDLVLPLPFDSAKSSDRKITAWDLGYASSNHPKIYLFLSDFFSPIWDDWSEGSAETPTVKWIIKELKKQGHLVGLAHVFPRHLWQNTAIFPFFDEDGRLEKRPLSSPFDREKEDPLPIFHLSANSWSNELNQWARSLAGDPQAKVSMLNLKKGENWRTEGSATREVDWGKIAEDFLSVASADVARLALYFSCLIKNDSSSLLSPDVISYLAQEMIVNLDSADFMALFSSGLFKFEGDKGVITFVNKEIPDALIKNEKLLSPHKKMQVILAYLWEFDFHKDPQKMSEFLDLVHKYRQTRVPKDGKTPLGIELLIRSEILESEEITHHERIYSVVPSDSQLLVQPKQITEDDVLLIRGKLSFQQAEMDVPIMPQDITPSPIVTNIPSVHIALWGENDSLQRRRLMQTLMRAVKGDPREDAWGSVYALGRYHNRFIPRYFTRHIEPNPGEVGMDEVFLLKKGKENFSVTFHDFQAEVGLETQKGQWRRSRFSRNAQRSDVLLLCVSQPELEDTHQTQVLENELLELYHWIDNQQSRSFEVFLALSLDSVGKKKKGKQEQSAQKKTEDAYNLFLSAGIGEDLCKNIFVKILDGRRAFTVLDDKDDEGYSARILFEEITGKSK